MPSGNENSSRVIKSVDILTIGGSKLANAPLLELPTDRPRPVAQSYLGDRVPFKLTSDLSAKLSVFNRGERATPFMTFLAAYQVLLSRYSRQGDILVGTPIANRRHTELENMIGFFVNALVMRADLSVKPTFRELLARTRQTVFDAYQYQDLPFEKLVQELNPQRDLSRHPIFQVSFTLQNAPFQPLALSGLEVSEQGVYFNSDTLRSGAKSLGRSGSVERLLLVTARIFLTPRRSRRLAGQYQVLAGCASHRARSTCLQIFRCLRKQSEDRCCSQWNNSGAGVSIATSALMSCLKHK